MVSAKNRFDEFRNELKELEEKIKKSAKEYLIEEKVLSRVKFKYDGLGENIFFSSRWTQDEVANEIIEMFDLYPNLVCDLSDIKLIGSDCDLYLRFPVGSTLDEIKKVIIKYGINIEDSGLSEKIFEIKEQLEKYERIYKVLKGDE